MTDTLHSSAELLVRSFLALAMAAGVLLAAYAAALRLCAPGGILVRWVATVAALVWIPSALFHALALPRLFAPLPALVSIALIAGIACRAAGGRAIVRRGLARDVAFARRVAARLRRSPHRGVVFAFFVCTAPALLRALLLPPLGWDTLTYHGVKAGMWVQYGGVDAMTGTGPWAYYQNMVAGGEVFSAWAMLPLRSDALAPLVDVAQWLALGLVLVVFARQLSGREPFASTAAGFVLTVPTIRLMVGSGYVELGLLVALISGMALGVRAWRHGQGGLLVLALGALGVSAATKVPMIPLAGVVSLILIAGTRRTVHRAWAAMALLAFAIAVVPWPLRTLARTGLPFSPLPIEVGGLVLGVPSPEVAWYLHRPEIRPYDPLVEIGLLKGIFAVPGTPGEALGLLTLIPFAVSVVGWRRLARRNRRALALVAVAAAINIATYYSPDFSVVRHYFWVSSSRFLLPLVALLTMVSICWCRPRSPSSRLHLTVLRGVTTFAALSTAVTGFSPDSIYGVFLLLTMALALAIPIAFARTRGHAAGPIAATVLVALVGLQLLRGHLRQDLLANDFVLHEVPKYWSAAVPLVDDPSAPRRIAVTSGPLQRLDNWFASPFLGRALQNELLYAPVSADGVIRPFGRGAANDELRRTARFEAWHHRLLAGHVTEVMSFAPASIELEWMEARPDLFTRLAGEPGQWGLFAVAYAWPGGRAPS